MIEIDEQRFKELKNVLDKYTEILAEPGIKDLILKAFRFEKPLTSIEINIKISEEYYCLHLFLKSIEENENVILEFTGAGCHKFAIKRALELSNDKIIILNCKNRDFSIITERIKNKELNKNFPFNTDIEKHIIFIKEELDKDLIENFWKIKNSINISAYMDTSDDLTENIDKIIKIFKEF